MSTGRALASARSAVRTPTEIDAAFDGIAYEKGAAVLRMVENYVGAEAFRKGINAYLQERLSGMRIVHLFGRERAEMDKFEALNRALAAV